MCCSFGRKSNDIFAENLVQEVQISETLLKGKQQLTESTTKCLGELDKIWQQFQETQFAELFKSSQEQFTQCTKEGSLWVLRNTPPISGFFTLHEILGSPGAYGIVKRAVNIESKQEFAVKHVNKLRYKDKRLQKLYFNDLRNEVYLMSQAHDHPHIVTCHGVFEDIDTLYVVLTYLKGGELYNLITEKRSELDEKMAANIFRQMVSSIYYLHQLGIAHCDLKPENFVFADKEQKQLKLIDFGMAKIVNFRKYFDSVAGSPYYVAPEVLRNRYNEACDIWSLGITLFLLIFGYVPFFDTKEDSNAVYKKILKGFNPKINNGYGPWFPASNPVTPHCRDLISRMLRTNCADRMTAEETLEHPWLKANEASEEKDDETQQQTDKLQNISNPAILNSLRFYRKNTNVLHGEVLNLLADCNYLNKHQRTSLEEFLKAMDENGDGKISQNELFAALKKFDKDITMNDVDTIFQSIDINSDNYVTYEELLSSRINRKLKSKESRLKKVFSSLDYNGDGTITVPELEAAWESVTNQHRKSQDFRAIVKEVDQNGDGKIDYEEFLGAFCKSRRNSEKK